MSTNVPAPNSPTSVVAHLSGGSLQALGKKTAESVVNRFGSIVQQYLKLTSDVGDWDANCAVARDIALVLVPHIAIALQHSQGFEVPDHDQREPTSFEVE
jgi:hypothetical protein